MKWFLLLVAWLLVSPLLFTLVNNLERNHPILAVSVVAVIFAALLITISEVTK